MAALRPAAAPSPVWGRRLTEWGVLLAFILVVVGVGYAQTQRLRGQAELARLKSTLGVLRTALVVAHLERTVQAERKLQGGMAIEAAAVPPVSPNPFLALSRLPPNYLGESSPLALVDLPGGNWVFDAACQCIGYRPSEAGWLEAPVGAVALWFQVSAPPGPLQITVTQPYVWMGQKVE